MTAKFSATQRPKSRASTASPRMKTGARCMHSSTTVALDSAALGEQTHAAVVAGDQRTFGGGERDEEVTLGMFAVDANRPGDADGHLRDANEILDVAGKDRRVERVLCHVREIGAGSLANEIAADCRHRVGIVVLAIARHTDPVKRGALGLHGLPPLETEGPSGAAWDA